jgi:isopentenyl phosphate kinase
MILIKLGGSILTHKKTSHKFRLGDIKRIAKEIQRAQKEKPQPIIIVHGAGGETHAMAKKFHLEDGALNNKQILGAMQTHFTVAKLQTALVKALTKEKLNVTPLYSGDYFYYSKSGKLTFKNLSHLKTLSNKRVIPILNGDMIPDLKKNFSILSGDKIIILLAQAFKVKTIIFASDVDGFILNNKLVQKLSVKELNKAVQNLNTYKGKDATGDLPGKLKAITKKEKKAKVLIVNGLKNNRIYSALIGKKVIGTKIR